jgi:hypothetical protein
MATDDETHQAEAALDEGATGRQVAAVSGMSADAAATFAAFYSGRFAHRSAFPEADAPEGRAA